MARAGASKGAAFPFPFIGGGVPSPFESLQYEIFFATAPDRSARAAVVAGFPPAIGATLRDDRLSLAAGAPELHGDVAAFAAERPNKDGFASSRAFAKLAVAIEDRLQAIHHEHPIRLALLVMDGESDPPKKSRWHTASARQIPELLSMFSHVLAAPAHADAELVQQLVTYARMSRVKLPPEWKAWSEPGRRVVAHMLADRIEEARATLRAHAGDRIFVFHLQALMRMLTRDETGEWARSQLAKWPQDVPFDASVAADWARHRPTLRRACIALAPEIVATGAPLTATDLSCRDDLLPSLAELAVDEAAEVTLTSPEVKVAFDATLAYERKRFLEHLERAALRTSDAARARRYRVILRALGSSNDRQ